MSVILEALRKSEQQRRRAPLAHLMAADPPPPAGARVWPAVVAAALGLNLLVLGVLLGLPGGLGLESAPPASAPAVAEAPAAAPLTDAPPVRPAEPPPAAPAADRPTPPADPPRDRAAPAEPPRAPAPEVAVAAAPVPAPAPVPEPVSDPYFELPTRSELSPNVAVALPALHMSMHMYASADSRRFVRINDRVAREGQTLDSGVRVEGISEHGVVLSFGPARFRIDRP